MQESLNEKLQRVESSLTTIKNNLHFEANAVIEDVAASTDIKRLTNIFVQENEPATKEGIWIQADPAQHPYEDLIVDAPVAIPGKWQMDTRIVLPQTATADIKSFVISNDKIYTRTGGSGTLYITDAKTGQLLKTLSAGYAQSKATDLCVMPDGNLIWGNSSDARVLDTTTDTIIQQVSTNDSMITGCYSAYDNVFYSAYATYGRLSKWDLNTNTYSFNFLSTGGYNTASKMVNCGQYLIIIGIDRTRVYDLANNYRLITPPASLQSYTCTEADGKNRIFIDLDNYLYFTNGKDYTIRINKDTLELNECHDKFVDEAIDNVYGMAVYKNNIVGLTGPSASSLHYTAMPFDGTEYDRNAIVIVQAQARAASIHTQLWDSVFTGRFLYMFYDVYYYNKTTGLNNSLPTYYGDGTKWIKFKN